MYTIWLERKVDSWTTIMIFDWNIPVIDSSLVTSCLVPLLYVASYSLVPSAFVFHWWRRDGRASWEYWLLSWVWVWYVDLCVFCEWHWAGSGGWSWLLTSFPSLPTILTLQSQYLSPNALSCIFALPYSTSSTHLLICTDHGRFSAIW